MTTWSSFDARHEGAASSTPVADWRVSVSVGSGREESGRRREMSLPEEGSCDCCWSSVSLLLILLCSGEGVWRDQVVVGFFLKGCCCREPDLRKRPSSKSFCC